MRKTPAWLGMCFLLSVCSFGVGGREEKADALALIQKARELSDIRAEGSPPFRLHAWIDFPSAMDLTLARGSYLETWNSPDHWRREIKGMGYEEVTVRVGNKLYRKANMPYRPWPLFRLDEVFAMRGFPEGVTNTVVRSAKDEKFGGVTLVCVVETAQSGFPEVRSCVNRDNGLLTLVVGYSGKMEYAAYAKLEAREFPQLLRWSFGGRVVADVHVDTLSFLTDVAANIFEPPEGSEESGTCGEREQPTRISGREPDYPSRARLEKIQGTNLSYVAISKSGEVIHAEIVRALEPSLDAASLEAIRRWRFRPAQCGGHPIDAAVTVENTFRVF